MTRDSFQNKYSNLSQRWNINTDLVAAILLKYEKQLLVETEKLATQRMQLPKYFKDKRTDQEYLYDIIDGWVVEDIICEAWLKPLLIKRNSAIKINLNGSDSDRVVQKYNANKITTHPDIVFSVNGKDIGIELQMARRTLADGYDMKETKVQRSITNGNYFLWIIVPDNTFYIVHPQSEMKNLKAQPNPLWGNKMVYHISQKFINDIGGYVKINEGITEFYFSKLGV